MPLASYIFHKKDFMTVSIKEMPMKNDVRLALLEASIKNIDETLKRIEKKLETFDSKFDHLGKRVDDKSQSINNRLWSNFLWLVGFGITLYGSLFVIIAHALKWV